MEISEVTAAIVYGPYSGADVDEQGNVVIKSLVPAGMRALLIRYKLCQGEVQLRQRAEPLIVIHPNMEDDELLAHAEEFIFSKAQERIAQHG